MIADDDRWDMQGLLYSGYSKTLPHAAYLLLELRDPLPAKECLAALIPKVTSVKVGAATHPKVVNMAFTYAGLGLLGLSPGALNGFSRSFRQGMTSDRSVRLIGDVGENAPSKWDWGGDNGQPVHAVLLLYTETAKSLEDLIRDVCALFGESIGVRVLDARPERPNATEHFGFLDGVSQPFIAGLNREGERPTDRQQALQRRANTLPAGEFILGYPNAAGAVCEEPSVSRTADADGLLHRLPVASRAHFGRNGTYLVFRQLEQDVLGFRQVTAKIAEKQFPDRADGVLRLQAKLVGRWHDGTPLVASDDPPTATPNLSRAIAHNQFHYAKHDPHGEKCPVGAHIRRANPRDGTIKEKAANTLRRTERHRLLRRGRAYGDDLPPDQQEIDGVPRGLHFICLNADIEQQFEFVQRGWLNNKSFAPFCDETDALLAGAHEAGRFTIPIKPIGRRVLGLSSFVTVKGGSYFFLPGIRALKFLLR